MKKTTPEIKTTAVVQNSNDVTPPKKGTVEWRESMKSKFVETLKLDRVAGNITVAAAILDVARKTIYEWRNDDASFNDLVISTVSSSYETRADMAEDMLEAAVRKGNVTAIIFTLKNLRSSKWNKGNDGFDPNATVNHVHRVSGRFMKVLDKMLPKDETK